MSQTLRLFRIACAEASQLFRKGWERKAEHVLATARDDVRKKVAARRGWAAVWKRAHRIDAVLDGSPSVEHESEAVEERELT